MKIETVKIATLQNREDNPRYILEEDFEILKTSITENPEMLKLQPIIVDEDYKILSGNQRYRAAVALGLSELYVTRYTQEINDKVNLIRVEHGKENRTYEEGCREIIIKANISAGKWDWEEINNTWNVPEIAAWGLKVYSETPLDYSVLDDNDVDTNADQMSNDVKKAILIEFEEEDYAAATEVIKFLRENHAYIGGMILGHLRSEKSLLEAEPK